MFKVLQAHEEREPKAVLKTQSKRAQKRLSRQEALREEPERLNGARGNDKQQQQQQAALQMYEELLLQGGDLDPDLLQDIEAQLGHLQLEPAGPAAASCAGGGYCAGAGDRRDQAALASARSAELVPLRLHVDSPPGPGPGSGSALGPGLGLGLIPGGGQPSTWLARQGSAPPLCCLEPAPSGSPHAAAGVANSRGRIAGSVLMRFGSRAGFFGADATASSGSGGAQPGTPAASGRVPAAPGFQQQLYPGFQAPGDEEAEEEFPELRPTVSAQSCSPACGGGGDGARRHGGRNGDADAIHARPRGAGTATVSKRATRHGSHHGGVKVLHTARPLTHGSHGHGDAPRSLRNGGGGGGEDESATDLNLSLLWDLIQGGLCLRGDPLAAEGSDLSGPGPDAAAAIKRLIQARYPEDDSPARGVSPEDMIAMMSRAHNRQCKTAGAGAAGGGGGGGSGDDESHLYLGRDESKSWRRTVEWMKENDWVLVTDTDGKHHKYRRLLPNGQIQTQTVCCSPSDALRGIRNLQADLARKDAQANAVIKAWRREERERRRRESAAAAAAQDG